MRSSGVLRRTENGRDLADDALQVIDRADGLAPRPPEGPAIVGGLLAVDPFVQVWVIRIRDEEVMSVSAADQAGGELPPAQLAGETLQVLMLFVGRHEPGRLGGGHRRNFTVVKSGGSVP